MTTDIEADVARIEAALSTPTLSLLDRKSALIALPIFASLFPPGHAEPIPVERFHSRVEALLDELRATGHKVPASSGKTLAMQWVRERWLFRDPGRGQETYRPTGDAEQAMEYVNRATRVQLNVSLSRIETMRRVVSDAAFMAIPDREARQRQLAEEIARLTAEHDRLAEGGEIQPASESELIEQFSNVLRELDGMPSDFRRVEEAIRSMHSDIARRFREEERSVGEVVDEYLDESGKLLTATPEGRAFAGALELLRKRDWLASLKHDLTTILNHPMSDALLPDEASQLRTAVDVIRRGISDVLDQRQRLTTTLREHIENYDHIKNRELDEVLRGIDREMRQWMLTAKPRHHIEVDLVPTTLDISALKLRTFDPDSERAPEKLQDVVDKNPAAPTLDEIRKQGGPSLSDLHDRIQEQLADGAPAGSAASIFNDLPDELKRPVEILGLLHLFAQLGGELDQGQQELARAVRPDGSERDFLMPKASLPESSTPDCEGVDHDG